MQNISSVLTIQQNNAEVLRKLVKYTSFCHLMLVSKLKPWNMSKNPTARITDLVNNTGKSTKLIEA